MGGNTATLQVLESLTGKQVSTNGAIISIAPTNNNPEIADKIAAVLQKINQQEDNKEKNKIIKTVPELIERASNEIALLDSFCDYMQHTKNPIAVSGFTDPFFVRIKQIKESQAFNSNDVKQIEDKVKNIQADVKSRAKEFDLEPYQVLINRTGQEVVYTKENNKVDISFAKTKPIEIPPQIKETLAQHGVGNPEQVNAILKHFALGAKSAEKGL